METWISNESDCRICAQHFIFNRASVRDFSGRVAQFSNRWGHLKLASPNILIAINLGFESNFNMCETMQQSNGLLIFTNRHFLKANIETYFQGLDFRTGGATLYQKLTGGMPPVPPALTEALNMLWFKPGLKVGDIISWHFLFHFLLFSFYFSSIASSMAQDYKLIEINQINQNTKMLYVNSTPIVINP